MSEARIGFIFPSRERPDKFFRCLDNIQDMSESKNYFVWAKLDEDDPFAEQYKEKIHEYPELTVKWGLSNNKVHAINRSLEDLPECDILIIMSDDIRWDAFAFDTDIREAFQEHFPAFDGTIHTRDDHGVENTIIVSILGVHLYKKLGYLYHPDFVSVYADNHFTEMTKAMGRHVFVNKRLFSHLHPIWNLSEWDQQYRNSEAPEVYAKDRETFLRLRSNNYGL